MRKVILIMAMLVLSSGHILFAQDPQPSAPSQSLFDIYIVGGGPIGWLIIALSVAMVAIIIENMVTLQRDKLVPPEVIAELEQLFEEGNYEEAMNVCDSTRNFVTNVLGVSLAKMQDGYESMVSAAESAIVEESTRLTHKTTWLNLIGQIGPMLGLFGTVVGMVVAFTEIAFAPTVNAQMLAKGIYTALVTTVWGLIVAMPALSFYFIIRNRVQRLTLELSGVAAELVERLKPVTK